MSLTIAKVHDPDGAENSGGVYDVTCDNSYPAGGYLLTPSTFGRRALHSVIPVQKGTANRLITYDTSTSNPGVLRVWTAIGTEAVAATDQSTISCRVRLTGPIL